MTITSLKFSNIEETSINVTTDTGSYSAPWPCHTWHTQDIQEAIDAGLLIEPYKTYGELEKERKSIRKQEIISTLNYIDVQSVRSLRAMVNGTATSFDTNKLTSLDSEAGMLRVELKTLTV